MTSPVPVLQAQGIVKEFRSGPSMLRVLDGVNFTVQRGERVAVVGASGSGKTTLLQVLGGLDLPTQGEVHIAGEAMTQLGEAARGELRNRAAVARALVTRPALLLADEPTGNLDGRNAEAVFALMLELNVEFGTSLVVVTHDERLAARMDRRVTLLDGRLVEMA